MLALLKPTPAWRILCAAAVSLALGQSGPRSAFVPLPDWTGTGRCVIRHDAEAIAAVDVRGHVVRLPCPGEAATAACDIEGAEPFDQPLADPCRGAALPLVRARVATVLRSDAAPLTVQWLQVGGEGRITVVADRQAPTGSPFAIAVSASAARLLRFLRSGSAPFTVPALDLSGTDSWRLPPATAGAELLLWRVASPVPPARYLVQRDGREAELARAPGDLTFVHGIPAGAYRIIPVYDGGVHASVDNVRLEDGRSVVLALPHDEVGGVRVNVPAALCGDLGRLRVSRTAAQTVPLPGGGQTVQTFATSVAVVEGQCDTTIGGLAPGHYRVTVESRQGVLLVQQPFEVQVDSMTDLAIALPARLSGSVSWNGRPLAQVTLEFVPQGGSRPAAQGRTDDTGRYSADFIRPGIYTATLRIGEVPVAGQQREVTIRAGETTFDWKLTGGSLALTIDNLERNTGGPVQIDLDQVSPRVSDGRPGFSHRIGSRASELDERPIMLRALGFGVYAVWVRQFPAERGGTTRTSRRVEFTLTDAKPEAKVTVSLQENTGRLVLTGLGAKPVEGASVFGRGFSAREVEPGVYSMDGVPPGFLLNIRATGYAATCRAAPDGVADLVALDAGLSVEVRFPGLDPTATSPVGEMISAQSACPVALDAFPFTKLPVEGDGVPAFLISNFPSGGTVNYSFVNEPPRSLLVLPGQPLIIPIRKVR